MNLKEKQSQKKETFQMDGIAMARNSLKQMKQKWNPTITPLNQRLNYYLSKTCNKTIKKSHQGHNIESEALLNK